MSQPSNPSDLEIGRLEADKFETGGEDRRGATRVSFAARISVCDASDAVAAEEDEFHPVKAINLSQSGISFRTTRWPRSDRVTVRFSETGVARRVLARVIDCRRELFESGDARYEVRCEFREWLSS